MSDTIAAIATPQGHGGLAVLRVSGPMALEVVGRVFLPFRGQPLAWEEDDHRLVLGYAHVRGQRLDQCVAGLFHAPRSYTGEDVIELSCHGSQVVSRQILLALLEAGARYAEPGEFTRRAFENGKLDLVQAESVFDLIMAHGDQSARLALSQLTGRLSARIRAFRESMLQVVAELQAELEFPDEDLTFERKDALARRLRAEAASMEELLATYEEGRSVRQGFSCVLAGHVNVGKSTLSNALLGQERSIVTDLPGTTRDIVESRATIRGLPVTLLDTAGLRESEDTVEREGIRRTRASLEEADLVLLVVDSTLGPSEEDERLREQLERRGRAFLVVWNKTDLPGSRPLPEAALPVSALTGEGLEELRDAIARKLAPITVSSSERLLISNQRQRDALDKARECVGRALGGFEAGLGSELIVEDLRDAFRHLGRILGETTPDDILDDIFRRFCIGK